LKWRGQMDALRRHWRAIFIVGAINSALPFLCFSYAALSISAGLSAIFNAASPLFGALVAWLWLNDKLTRSRVLGLAIGFGGVIWLASDKASFKPAGSGWAIVACLAGAAFYGIAANFAKKRLNGVPPMAVAAGSQLSAALVLLVPAVVWWPHTMPSHGAWIAAGLLAVACTGMAYLLYFRLIAHVGPANAIAVTFPVFAVLWGWFFIDERITAAMVAGCAVILVGTGLTTGVLKWPSSRRAAQT